nr:hypothetical protein [Pseudomonas mendocina]
MAGAGSHHCAPPSDANSKTQNQTSTLALLAALHHWGAGQQGIGQGSEAAPFEHDLQWSEQPYAGTFVFVLQNGDEGIEQRAHDRVRSEQRQQLGTMATCCGQAEVCRQSLDSGEAARLIAEFTVLVTLTPQLGGSGCRSIGGTCAGTPMLRRRNALAISVMASG